MKKRIFQSVILLLFFCGAAVAAGGLDLFISSLNDQARGDRSAFSARVSAQFGVPVPQVEAVIGAVATPADAFLVFQLGRLANQPPREVLRVYKANRGKGWGVIAKNLGIKPGSPEFHALKRGDFVLQGGPPGKGQAKGQGKGKGKGHYK